MLGRDAIFALWRGLKTRRSVWTYFWTYLMILCAVVLAVPTQVLARQAAPQTSGEANLVLPDLRQATFFNGLIDGQSLLLYSLIFVVLGLLFGVVIYAQLKKMPV